MSKRIHLTAAATLALAWSYPLLGAESPSPATRNVDEIRDLKARIEQLEFRQAENKRQREQADRARDVNATSEQLSNDALKSEQFLTAEGFTAGYTDNRFVIQSGDGNFAFRPWIHFQFRDVTLERNDFQGTKKHPENQIDNGFEVRQVRFGFDGNAFSPDLTYFFNWATQRTNANSTVKSSTGTTVGTVSNGLGGVPVLQQAWAKYKFPTTPFAIKAGQIKDPLLHEQIVDTRFQQATERSLTADIFANGDDFTEAVTFIYDPNTFIRTEVGVNHGMRSANTNFLDYPNNGGFNPFNYGFVGRVEYKVMGRWKDYAQIGAVGTTEPLLVFGGGADYSERGRDGQLVAVADVMYADQTGLNFYGSFVDRYTTHNFGAYLQSATGDTLITPDPAIAGRSTNEYSILAEAGYLINKHVEPFGRYEYMRLQGTAVGSHNNVQAITGGVNYYFYGHRLKTTAQVTWLPKGLPFDESPNDVLANPNGKSEISFIAQLQLIL